MVQLQAFGSIISPGKCLDQQEVFGRLRQSSMHICCSNLLLKLIEERKIILWLPGNKIHF